MMKLALVCTLCFLIGANETKNPEISQETLEGFRLFCRIGEVSPAVRNDLVRDGGALLFYRLAQFLQVHEQATPEQALVSADRVVRSLPAASVHANRITVNMPPNTLPDSSLLKDDKQWIEQRVKDLMERAEATGGALMINDNLNLPLPPRILADVLSQEEVQGEIAERMGIIGAAIETYRAQVGEQAGVVSKRDLIAAEEAASTMFHEDYTQINGYYVQTRGSAMLASIIDLDQIARFLIDWQGPTLRELDNVGDLTLAPYDGYWVLIDAANRLSVKDPIIARYTIREFLLIHKALEYAHEHVAGKQ